LNRAKKSYYDDQLKNSENVGKKSWEIINRETGKNTTGVKGSISTIKNKNAVIDDPLSISNTFNHYFIDIIDEIAKSTDKPANIANYNTNQNEITKPFRCNPVTEKEIRKVISSLKNKCSSGHDDIPLKLIKYVGDVLLKPLVHLINCSFVSGNFPDGLKKSRVVPIFKKGIKSERVITALCLYCLQYPIFSITVYF